jgi:hypothetical protein
MVTTIAHFTETSLAVQLLFQAAQGLLHVTIAYYYYYHIKSPPLGVHFAGAWLNPQSSGAFIAEKLAGGKFFVFLLAF